MMLDKVVFSLIDDGYNLMFNLSGAYINDETVKEVIKNLYIIVGIFAFFKIAVLLINSIIDPEKLNEKGKGLSSILWRTVVMLVILVLTPFIFDAGYDLQNKIMDDQIVEKLILRTGASGDNPGNAFKTITISSLITVNKFYWDDFTSTSAGEAYVGYNSNGTCNTQECENAIDKWNETYASGNMNISDISPYITVSQKNDDGDDEYVYDYMVVVTTFAGGFIVYMLFSFAIDIAIRVFKLAVLEVISPLFIVTFIDPKSTSSGMFSRWLKEVGSTYANLFIKVACISLTVLLVSLLNTENIMNINETNTTNTGLIKLTLMLGLLVFAKQAPKLISELIGIKSDGNGLSIGKKLASAALIGGAIGKGLDGVKKGIGNQAKKVARGIAGNAAGRLAGTAAARRITRDKQKDEGSLRSKYKQNREAGMSRKEALGSYFSEGRKRMNERAQAGIKGGQYGAVSGSRTGLKAKNASEVGAILGQTYKGMTSEAGHEGINAKISGKLDNLEANFKAKAIGSDSDLRSRREDHEKIINANKLRAHNISLNADGTRDKNDWQNKIEMDKASISAQNSGTGYSAKIRGGAAIPQQMILEDAINHGAVKNFKLDGNGYVVSFEDRNGNEIRGTEAINKFINEYGKSEYSMAGIDTLKEFCAKNAEELQSKYVEASKKLEDAAKEIAGYNVNLSKLNMDKTNLMNSLVDTPILISGDDGSELRISAVTAYEQYLNETDIAKKEALKQALKEKIPYQFDTLQSIDGSIGDVKTRLADAEKIKENWGAEHDILKSELIEVCMAFDGTNEEYKSKDNPLANPDGVTLVGSYDSSGHFIVDDSASSTYSFDSAIHNTQIKVGKLEEKTKKSLADESKTKSE